MKFRPFVLAVVAFITIVGASFTFADTAVKPTKTATKIQTILHSERISLIKYVGLKGEGNSVIKTSEATLTTKLHRVGANRASILCDEVRCGSSSIVLNCHDENGMEATTAFCYTGWYETYWETSQSNGQCEEGTSEYSCDSPIIY